MGASYARALFVSADRFSADQAQKMGLVHQVYEDATQLQDGTHRLIEKILQCGPQALSVAKKMVLDLTWPERRAQLSDCLESVAQILAEIRVSKEGQEGVRAFLEKRKPLW
jgi:methylglutaconyl-CoA hydratase